MVEILKSIDAFIFWGICLVVLVAIALVLLRSLFKYIDKNPFTWSAITVKRLTDPVILSVRRLLVAMRLDPIAAPLIAIIGFILVGVFAFQVSNGLLNTIAGFIEAGTSGKEDRVMAILGYLVYALIGLYELMIFARIIGSWFTLGYGRRWMRFLIQTTEPLLGPVRRIVPMAGMFDISPMVALLILWILQQVVAGTLLKGWTVRFF